MRVAGVLFDVVDIVGDAVVLVNMADAVKMQLIVAARARDPVAMDDPVQPLVQRNEIVKWIPAGKGHDSHPNMFGEAQPDVLRSTVCTKARGRLQWGHQARPGRQHIGKRS